MIHQKLLVGLHIGVWLVSIVGYVLIFDRFFPLHLSLLRAFGNVLPMAVIFYVNLYLVNRFLEQKKYVLYFLLAGLIIGAFVVLRVQINLTFPDIKPRALLLNEPVNFRFGALSTNILVLLLSVFYQILQNRYRNEQRNLQIISEQREAQLQFLRGQINPHFLFNTLNNIYSLAVIGSEKTAELVLKLSNLLRYVIYDSQAGQVFLNREMYQIHQVIELFQMRSEEPLNIEFRHQGLTEGFLIEPMILLPIVENCFKHCDFDSNPEAYVRVESQTLPGGHLYFRTLNSKDDYHQQKDKVGGVGLENIKMRLNLKYPDQHYLQIRNEAHTFEVTLSLQLSVDPQKNKQAHGRQDQNPVSR